MKLIRWFLGKVILFLDAIFSPTVIVRSEQEQEKLNGKLLGISLYQFEACPFCVKVRRHLRANKIQIPLRNALIEPYRAELLAGGGKNQTPCLRIDREGKSQWMYESSEIIAYFNRIIAES